MDCLKRKHPKKREHKKAHHLSPHVSPSHSQPSTLGNYKNGSLPQVSSTGLWMDTPSVYAVTQPPNFYHGRAHGYSMSRLDHPYNIPRAASETRIPVLGLPYLPRPHFGSQNNVYLMPMAPQRFYRSQPLAPVYELPPTRGMEIYDYPYPGFSPGETGGLRSKLLETRHTPEYYNNTSQFMLQPRVERAKSDAENKRPSKPVVKKEPPKQNKTSFRDNNNKSASRDNNNLQPSGANKDMKLLATPKGAERVTSANVHGGQFYKDFSAQSLMTNGTTTPYAIPAQKLTQPPVPNNNAGLVRVNVSDSQHISSSATDSMKLLANNKTDDQKTQPSFVPHVTDNIANKIEDNDQEFNIRHYTYEGSIYAVSKRNMEYNDYENPLINRMKEMVIERVQHNKISAPRNDWSGSNDGVTSNNDITSTSERNTTALQPSNNKDVVDGLFLPDILNIDEEEDHRSPSHHASIQPESSNRSHAPASNVKDSSRPMADPRKSVVSYGSDADTDGGTEDINKAGKQIATSAFQFLNNYISDDEGGEDLIDSPPLSPGGRRVG